MGECEHGRARAWESASMGEREPPCGGGRHDDARSTAMRYARTPRAWGGILRSRILHARDRMLRTEIRSEIAREIRSPWG